MSDMLKITTPILPRNYINGIKPNQNPSQDVFNLVDLTKVSKPNEHGETTTNNTLNLSTGQEARHALIELLKDPGLAITSLRRLLLLSGVIINENGEISAANPEMNALLKFLMLNESNLLTEIFSQQQGISSFKGEFFDALRSLLSQTANPEFRESVGILLKSITGRVYASDILDSISVNLEKFAELMRGIPDVAEALKNLSANFKNSSLADNHENYNELSQLKDSLISVLREINGSIYANPKTMSLTTLIVYNLSKFVNDKDEINSAFDNFARFLPEEMRESLKESLLEYLSTAVTQSESANLNSQVIGKLSELISEHLGGKSGSFAGSQEISDILQSLASAPTAFTPLLHYILPLAADTAAAFAEMWVDPDASKEKHGKSQSAVRIFLVSDIEGFGHFEIEMLVTDYHINLSLYCPKDYASYFEGFKDRINRACENTEYSFSSINIEPLIKERKLDEIFEKLSAKRSGIDVRA